MQAFFGGVVLVLAALLLIDGGPARRRVFRTGLPLSTAARRGLMGVLVACCAVLAAPALIPPLRAWFFAFCGACPIPAVDSGTATPAASAGTAATFLTGIWYYAATVLPVFVLACALSGLLAVRPVVRVRGVLGAFGLAAVLPVCSCGVIPLGKSMIDRGGPSVRAGLMFIAAAPLLSPIVIILGASVLGPGYVAVRVAASFVMGAVVALVVPAFLSGPADEDRPGGTGGTSPASPGRPPAPSGSALDAGLGMLAGLFRYALYGIVVGAAVAALLPAGLVANVMRAGVLSLSAAVVVGVPVNLCAGEEILLTAPLAGMGFTMGHAIAFALAGTGICVSSLPLLRAVLGRRATLAMVALYLVVPFALGVLLTLLPVTPRLEPRLLPETAEEALHESAVTPEMQGGPQPLCKRS